MIMAIATRTERGHDPGDDNEQQIQPEETGDETRCDQFGQTTLQIINPSDQFGLESVLAAKRTQIVHNIKPVLVMLAFPAFES